MADRVNAPFNIYVYSPRNKHITKHIYIYRHLVGSFVHLLESFLPFSFARQTRKFIDAELSFSQLIVLLQLLFLLISFSRFVLEDLIDSLRGEEGRAQPSHPESGKVKIRGWDRRFRRLDTLPLSAVQHRCEQKRRYCLGVLRVSSLLTTRRRRRRRRGG